MEAWDAMLSVAAIFEAERKECEASIGSIEWESATLKNGVLELTCRACASPLLAPTESPASSDVESIVLRCRACGEDEDAKHFIVRSLSMHLVHERFESIRGGGETPRVMCPTCLLEAFVVAEWRCAYCGSIPERECERCDLEIPPEELSESGLCGFCEHMSGKDD